MNLILKASKKRIAVNGDMVSSSQVKHEVGSDGKMTYASAVVSEVGWSVELRASGSLVSLPQARCISIFPVGHVHACKRTQHLSTGRTYVYHFKIDELRKLPTRGH